MQLKNNLSVILKCDLLGHVPPKTFFQGRAEEGKKFPRGGGGQEHTFCLINTKKHTSFLKKVLAGQRPPLPPLRTPMFLARTYTP
jgi:hypothetical protein